MDNVKVDVMENSKEIWERFLDNNFDLVDRVLDKIINKEDK